MPAQLRHFAPYAAGGLLVWIALIAVAAGFVWIDRVRMDLPVDFSRLFFAYATGFAPWLVLLPLVFRFGEYESRRYSKLPDAVARGVLAGFAVFGAIMAYVLFAYAPLTRQTAVEALASQQFTQWLWDVSLFSGSYLCGRLYGVGRNQANASGGRIAVKSPDRVDFVPVDDLLAVTGQGNYVSLISEDREVLHRATLSEMEILLARHGFVRIHRSHLVRPDRIISARIRTQRVSSVTLPGSRTLPVSDPYGAELMTHLSEHLLAA